MRGRFYVDSHCLEAIPMRSQFNSSVTEKDTFTLVGWTILR